MSEEKYWIQPGGWRRLGNTPADAYVLSRTRRAVAADPSGEGWVQFTPLQQWQNAMHLLDCVAPYVAIPGVGLRLYTNMYMLFMEN